MHTKNNRPARIKQTGVFNAITEFMSRNRGKAGVTQDAAGKGILMDGKSYRNGIEGLVDRLTSTAAGLRDGDIDSNRAAEILDGLADVMTHYGHFFEDMKQAVRAGTVAGDDWMPIELPETIVGPVPSPAGG